MIGLDVRSCCPPYSFPSSLKGDAVAQSWCYHCCDGPRSYPPILSQFYIDTVIGLRGVSFFHQNQGTLFDSGSGRSASDSIVLVLSSESSLLMAMLQVVVNVLTR